MARYKSCFTLKNILLIVFAIMIMKRFILKEVLKEGHTDDDGNLKDEEHVDDNHEDHIYYLFGAQPPAPMSGTNRGFKYLTKIKGVKKGTQVVSDNIGGLDSKDTTTENSDQKAERERKEKGDKKKKEKWAAGSPSGNLGN